MDVWIQGKKVRLDPARSIGKGGEADVYDIGGGRALKVWTQPDCGARQQKIKAFPARLPSRVVAPRELAHDRSGQTVLGYTMDLVAGAEVLFRFGEPSFGRKVARTDATRVLLDLHDTLSALHRMGLVIGDFNDLNVLVRAVEAFVIDADSFQIGGFPCRVFTDRFVDPLLCDKAAASPLLSGDYSEASDWYAFAAMVLQTLAFVGPWGGVHKPSAAKDRVPQPRRPLERVSVFRSDVVTPKHALPLAALPDDLLGELERIFERDHRAPFPKRLLEAIQWTTCSSCGVWRAREKCPVCKETAVLPVMPPVVVRGKVTAKRLLSTTGAIVAVAVDRGVVRWVVHEADRFMREDGRTIGSGALDPSMSFFIDGDATIITKAGRAVEISPVDSPKPVVADAIGMRPIFAINDEYRFSARAGVLYRSPKAGARATGMFAVSEERIGDVLSGQTLFWVGPAFGFGFYRAGEISVAFVFDAKRGHLNDTVVLPRFGGQLVAATATLDGSRCWLFLAIEAGGRAIHRCVVIAKNGRIEATHDAAAGDGSWLGTLGGKCALNGFLLAPTDEGVVRVEVRGSAIAEARKFADTEPFVDAGSELFTANDGIVAASQRSIVMLAVG